MKYFKGKVSLIIVFILLSSCDSSGGLAPQDVKGLSISYYAERVGGVFDKGILHKNVVYEYRTDGTYEARLDGKFYDAGDYTFHLENPNRVQIILTYSDQDNSYLYVLVMNYDTNASGTWHATLSNNPHLQHSEGGTFTQELSGK